MNVIDAPGRARPGDERVPAVDGRAAGFLLAVVRIGLGLLWLTNAAWKVPPDFTALRHFTEQAVRHPVFDPFSWLVEHVVLPNFTVFAWGVLIVESGLGAFLLIGLATRLWAVIGVLQSLAIMFSVLNAPGEWQWSYYLLILSHVAVFAAGAGRMVGLDGVLRPRWSDSRSSLARVLLRVS